MQVSTKFNLMGATVNYTNLKNFPPNFQLLLCGGNSQGVQFSVFAVNQPSVKVKPVNERVRTKGTSMKLNPTKISWYKVC